MVAKVEVEAEANVVVAVQVQDHEAVVELHQTQALAMSRGAPLSPAAAHLLQDEVAALQQRLTMILTGIVREAAAYLPIGWKRHESSY